MNNTQKAAVIGCGFVGSSIAFMLIQSDIFSESVLIDINRDKAEGEIMDPSHGLPFTHPMDIRVGDYDNVANCTLVIVTTGAGQKPGETRLDLVHRNVAIFRSIIPEIARYNRDVILLIMSSPMDVFIRAAQGLSGYPANRMLGLDTVPGTAQLKYLLGERLRTDNRSVYTSVTGGHGDNELTVWNEASVFGAPLDHLCELWSYYKRGKADGWFQREMQDNTYEIIRRKGATYYSAATTVEHIVRAIMWDEHSALPVSNLLQGQYSIDGLCTGIPAMVGRDEVEDTLEIPLSPAKREALQDSAATLRSVVDSLEL